MDWRSQHPALPRYEWGNHFTSWLHTVDDMILTKYVIYIYVYIHTYIHIYMYIYIAIYIYIYISYVG